MEVDLPAWQLLAQLVHSCGRLVVWQVERELHAGG